MTAKPATERAEEERERSVRALGAQPLGASAGMLLLQPPHDRLARLVGLLLRAEGLRGIPREKTRKTTISGGAETEQPEDLVKRMFVATAPNQLWVADLT